MGIKKTCLFLKSVAEVSGHFTLHLIYSDSI